MYFSGQTLDEKTNIIWAEQRNSSSDTVRVWAQKPYLCLVPAVQTLASSGSGLCLTLFTGREPLPWSLRSPLCLTGSFACTALLLTLTPRSPAPRCLWWLLASMLVPTLRAVPAPTLNWTGQWAGAPDLHTASRHLSMWMGFHPHFNTRSGAQQARRCLLVSGVHCLWPASAALNTHVLS